MEASRRPILGNTGIDNIEEIRLTCVPFVAKSSLPPPTPCPPTAAWECFSEGGTVQFRVTQHHRRHMSVMLWTSLHLPQDVSSLHLLFTEFIKRLLLERTLKWNMRVQSMYILLQKKQPFQTMMRDGVLHHSGGCDQG